MKIDETIVEEIRACSGKRDEKKCIDHVLEAHGVEEEKKEAVLSKILKAIDGAEKHGKKDK